MEGKASRKNRWVHVLLKGEKPITETKELDDKYVTAFKDHDLEAINIPILEFKFKNLDRLSQILEEAIENSRSGSEDVGLVLTSPRVVEAISRSLSSKLEILREIQSQLVFVVGERTGLDCTSKLEIEWNKNSSLTGNSASLSKVIKSTSSTWRRPVRLIYAKSSLADRTIEDALSNEENLIVDSIEVYETRGVTNVADHIRKELELYLSSNLVSSEKLVLNFIFFSPSGVDCFFTINQRELSTYLAEYASAKHVDIKYSCIGRTTEGCLRKYGANMHCLAERPSIQSLVDVILLKCRVASNDDYGGDCA